jgi:hypothetical protein
MWELSSTLTKHTQVPTTEQKRNTRGAWGVYITQAPRVFPFAITLALARQSYNHTSGALYLTSCTTQLLPSGSLKERNEP